MGVITIILASAALISLGLGIAVFSNNHQRKVNQAFLVASSCMFLWLFQNLIILHTESPFSAKSMINSAFAISAFIPTAFQFLRISIKCPELSWFEIIKKSIYYLTANLIVSAICFHPHFTLSVEFPSDGVSLPLATPQYGPPYAIFNAYFIVSIVLFAKNLYIDKKQLNGAQRIELEFLGFACVAGLVVGLLFGTIFALLIKSSSLVPVAHAISVLTLITIVSYGISVHKILAVAVILRRITAYSLLTCYLIFVYCLSWYAFSYALKELTIINAFPSHILSTLVVVFSMPPARKRIEKATDRLISIQSSDIPSVVKAAGEIFQSVTTYSALLSQFADLLSQSFFTRNIAILINRKECFEVTYASFSSCPITAVERYSALPSLIEKTHAPVCRDNLVRFRHTDKMKEAITQIDSFGLSIAVGIFSKSTLRGMVLLGSRINGRFYDKTEQDALQILCNQFAVALENAQMYTEMQDSKIRNEIMLDQLVSGVVLADTDRRITLFNHEAQRITGLNESDAIGRSIDLLPPPLCRALDVALEHERGERNIEAKLYEQDETKKSLSVRMGTTFLLGHDQKPMGALMVFTDMTELKSLEEQVRRSDQLSSVGTLAAGMAHEIKNPLVTIKTFTQLLPQRYNDEDFRQDFSALVAHEVARIDGIVNELLSFSKPTKPHLVPMRLHDTIEQILKLTHEQMAQRNISVSEKCAAETDRIQGDAKLLSQALINLILNAIEAIGSSGTITVGTSNCNYRFAGGEWPDNVVNRKCIRIQITDSGHGIPRENLQKIFDPFFTSKSEGTGMGLSVAHGIIQEHHGAVDVESEVGIGSTFYIYLPIINQEAA